jgi:hypothetical protein
VNELQETIAGQVAHMKPDWLRPGFDVIMSTEGCDELSLDVMVHPFGGEDEMRYVRISYDEGMDTYVTVLKTVHDTQGERRENVFCDDLGKIVYGEDAKEWSQPFGAIITLNKDGTTEIQEF